MNHARTQRVEEKVRQSTTRALLVLIHIIFHTCFALWSSFLVKHIDEGVLVADGLPASREKTIGSVSLYLYLSLSLSDIHTHIHMPMQAT